MEEMSVLEKIKLAFLKIGIDRVYINGEVLIYQTNIINGKIILEDNKIHFDSQLKIGIKRNKLNLWSVLNLNSFYVPNGQFYISKDNEFCLGGIIPLESEMIGKDFYKWAERWTYELLSASESFHIFSISEFEELPFIEFDFLPNEIELLKSELVPPFDKFSIDTSSASFMLERILNEHLRDYQIIRMSDDEIALAGDFVINISVQKLPQFRKNSHLNNWFIGISTEVGVVNLFDNKLLVMINRWNSLNYMLSHTIKYNHRKPIVRLCSELTPESLQHPHWLKYMIARHNNQAMLTTIELTPIYQIQSILDYKLGL